jgi:hypothetical protein
MVRTLNGNIFFTRALSGRDQIFRVPSVMKMKTASTNMKLATKISRVFYRYRYWILFLGVLLTFIGSCEAWAIDQFGIKTRAYFFLLKIQAIWCWAIWANCLWFSPREKRPSGSFALLLDYCKFLLVCFLFLLPPVLAVLFFLVQ